MLGEHVPRLAGWDFHGFSVELEVARELGIASKREVEEFGVGRFNDACRESVQRSVAEFERLSERIGCWLDTAGAAVDSVHLAPVPGPVARVGRRWAARRHDDIVEEPAKCWQISSEAGYTVGLDTAVDEPLRQEGLARELARRVNDERRKHGLHLGARISLQIEVLADPDGAVTGMLHAHADAIAADAWADNLKYRLDSDQPAGDAVTLGSGELIIILTPAEGEQQ